MNGALRAPASSYRVHLPAFEGPLDLLLHLVRRQRLDITEVSLAAVADQYFAYLERLRELDVEVESSYLVVFAQLLEIKSRVLLPEAPPEEPGPPPEQPPLHLAERLAAYALVRRAADWLAEQERASLARYPRPTGRAWDQEPELEVSVERLAAHMRRLEASPRAPRPPVEVPRLALSVPRRMRQLWERLRRRARVSFRELVGAQPSRSLVVVTFLALLEMARRRQVHLVQPRPGGELEVRRRVGGDP